MNKILAATLNVCLILSLACQAEEGSTPPTEKIITLEAATIRGNQELPTVLYLIPWQAPEIKKLAANQTIQLTDRPLEPIERYSFQRRIGYHKLFKSDQSPD